VLAAALAIHYVAPVHDPKLNFGGEMTAELYANGRIQSRKAMPAASSEAKKVMALLEGKAGHWERSRISFAPVILIRGKSFKLNFQRSRLIAEFTDADGSPGQLVTALTNDEFTRIAKLFD